jgi:hypothetical protein
VFQTSHDFFVPNRLQRDRSRQAVHISQSLSCSSNRPRRAVIAPSAMVIELSLLYVSFYITFMLQGRSSNDLSHSSILAGNRFIDSLPSLRVPTASSNVRYQGQPGRHLLALSFSQSDPLRKSPYQAAQICEVPASFEL